MATGPPDVVDIMAGDALTCYLGDMYDPSILNQLVPGSYTVKAVYSQNIPELIVGSPPLWTGSVELNTSIINLYKFTGFLPPVDNPPVWNVAKAGQTIPLKWQLENVNGPYRETSSVVSITAGGVPFPIPTEAVLDTISIYDEDNTSALQCYTDTGMCHYNWKTPKSYANGCATLTLKLDDGTERKANFQFKAK